MEDYKAFNNLNDEPIKDTLKDNLFNKKFHCPVCTETFYARTPKAKKALISNKDSDFFIRYKVINPYFYDVLLCPICGYATLKTEFTKIKKTQIDKVKIFISSKWKPRYYPDIYDEHIAIDRFKLALLTAIVIDSNESTKAMICLKIAWMYRLLEKNTEEIEYLNKAFSAFNNAYFNESLPAYGLDQNSILYLLGDIKRRVGEKDIAKKYLSEVLVSQSATQKLKELARDCRDLM